MVERERQENTAPIPETKTRVLETTLAELRVDTSFDNLNLARDRLTFGVKQVGEETVFVGLLHHPFAGGHFAQALNSVSPFPDQDVGGIINDVDLPILAERDYKAGKDKTTSNHIRLHERHLNDPRVGPPYIRFANDHVHSWLRALGSNSGLRVFETLGRIGFVNSKEDLRKELFSEDGSLRRPLKYSDEVERTTYYIGISNALSRYDYRRFIDFWENKSLRGKELAQTFIDTLTTKAEQEKFAVVYFNGMRTIIADLETHRIRRCVGNQSGKIKVRFDTNGRDVVVSNNRGTKVVISPTGQNSEKFSWRILDYQFSRDYLRRCLYPAFVWRKSEDGTRTLLTQQEAMPLVRELGLPEGEQADTKLGEITVASFARDIIKDWPATMALKTLERFKLRGVRYLDDEFEQPMRGAQMPAWVGIERHKNELLTSETSPLAIMEKRLAIV